MQDDAALALLQTATIEPIGVLTQASNLTLLVDLLDGAGEETGHRAVHKPARGERPLHDFPPGSLAAREAAAYVISRVGGFDLVPPTVLRDGPLGRGSLQLWVEQEPERLADPAAGLVDVMASEELPPGWRAVVSGEAEDGAAVLVAHADDPALRTMATLDVVLNNADRKAAHLTLDTRSRLRGFDHGLALHEDDKLRTVLWGFAGEPVAPDDLARLERLTAALDRVGATPSPTGHHPEEPVPAGDAARLGELLSVPEVAALRRRVANLLAAGVLPMPPQERYPLPWPLW